MDDLSRARGERGVVAGVLNEGCDECDTHYEDDDDYDDDPYRR